MTIASQAPFTYDDLLAMPDDGKQYEIIDGELVLNASPVPRHQIVALAIAAELRAYLKTNPIGKVYIAPLDVVLSPANVLQPDVLFVTNERANVVGEQNVSGAPDLVVEVLSTSTRKKDETLKRRLYESFGVTEIWIVDIAAEHVRIYGEGEGRFRMADEIVTSRLLPGFELRLAEIFAE